LDRLPVIPIMPVLLKTGTWIFQQSVDYEAKFGSFPAICEKTICKESRVDRSEMEASADQSEV
jgi:hypothetical protein